MTELEQSRNTINEVDRELARLFEKRMEAARTIALYKKKYGLPVFDAKREKEILEKEVQYISNPDMRSYYLDFLQGVLDTSKKYQTFLVRNSRIAYSGIEGAWANIAAKRIFPDGQIISYPSFQSAYQSVVDGECDFAVLPVENSFAGDVSQVFDLMHTGPLYMNGIYNLKIRQCLLGIKGSSVSDIKRVISHQQAIDQSTGYLRKHNIEVQSAVNTAVAAREVSQLNDKSVGAIASEDSASLYGLEVLERGINEVEMNTTRFVVFSPVMKSLESSDGQVFQMMFTVKNEPGSLARAVLAFGNAGFNMRCLKSRPIKDISWQYYFYVEGEGDIFSEKGQLLITELRNSCEEVKILGHSCMEYDI